MLEKANGVALTFDGWTSRARHGYLGLTAHFIDESFALQHATLRIWRVEGSHTGTWANVCRIDSSKNVSWQLRIWRRTSWKLWLILAWDQIRSQLVLLIMLQMSSVQQNSWKFQGYHVEHTLCNSVSKRLSNLKLSSHWCSSFLAWFKHSITAIFSLFSFGVKGDSVMKNLKS